jgi:two-component system, OmpR family, sensor histidine kinase ChvG
MTLVSKIGLRPKAKPAKPARAADVVLGEDWDALRGTSDDALRASRARRGFISINRSPLARKIIIFNLLAIIIMVAGVLYLNPFRDSLVIQRERGLVTEAALIAEVFEATLPKGAPVNFVTGDGADVAETLSGLSLPSGLDVFVFDPSGTLITTSVGSERAEAVVIKGLERKMQPTLITDFLGRIWAGVSGLTSDKQTADADFDVAKLAGDLVQATLVEGTQVITALDKSGRTVFSVGTPLKQGGVTVGVVAVTSAAGELDALVQVEREQVLQMFVIAILVSVGLSLVLASTIANPLSDLAAAAEIGRASNAQNLGPGRIRIPDLSGRPDEIGRLSGALRGMVAALYDRIDANEQFAADVAHEIKNPLASLRSAVGTMRVARRDDQREKLLQVIEHDVRRLDRLVTDISNASRLDSELVKEEEERFNLLPMLGNLIEHLGAEAGKKGVEFISDLPDEPVEIVGLEARLAQVFVNLIANATSFCDEGDAIRIWVRRRSNRVLIVVEDTGPGIPEQALQKIFKRFYSQRPDSQFGDNSGLGLAISKQIVEAHGGVIWAENIRPTHADITSEPLGARFVVGLPV